MKNNYVKLVGKIANDVKVNKTGGGRTVCRFTIYTEDDKSYGEGKVKEYIRCVAWGKVAEAVADMSKDDKIKAEGAIHNSSFEYEGEKRFSTDVVVEKVL